MSLEERVKGLKTLRYLRLVMGILILLAMVIFSAITLFYYQDWSAKKDDYKTINNAYRESWPGQPEYAELKKERGYKQGVATRANTQIESVALTYGGVVLILSLSFVLVTAAELVRAYIRRKDMTAEFEAWKAKQKAEEEQTWMH